MEFIPYPKTPRLKRSVVITEKLDGTNAQVVITARLDEGAPHDMTNVVAVEDHSGGQLHMRVGSRNRWITPGKLTDNYGFAQWCLENADELFKLGEGQHFGEWWGQGIARGYGMGRKVFSLFNTARWGDHNPGTPACCSVVPVLSFGETEVVMQNPDAQIESLRRFGSVAAPGFMSPEGIIVYHTAAKQNFKVLLENDNQPKGLPQ